MALLYKKQHKETIIQFLMISPKLAVLKKWKVSRSMCWGGVRWEDRELQ